MSGDCINNCMTMCTAPGSGSNDQDVCNDECNMMCTPNGGARIRKGSFESMTVKQLQQRCAKRKMSYSGLRKHELILKLRGKK